MYMEYYMEYYMYMHVLSNHLILLSLLFLVQTNKYNHCTEHCSCKVYVLNIDNKNDLYKLGTQETKLRAVVITGMGCAGHECDK